MLASTYYATEEVRKVGEPKAEEKAPVQDKASWRGLSVIDISSLAHVADKIHPDLPESDEVFAETLVLAREIRRLRPGLPVLIVSGYAEEEGIDPDIPRLTKPFRNAELA